jgi:predicted DNA-binding protein
MSHGGEIFMEENRERKNNLVTVRLSSDDMEVINDLSERTNRSVSDTILRACKFGLNVGDIFNDTDNNEQWGNLGRQQVHLRMTDSDKNMFDSRSRELGKSMSQFVRASIRAYCNSMRGYI